MPEIYREYVSFQMKTDTGEFVPADLLDFSPHGIRIKSPSGLPVDVDIECLISAPKSLTQEVSFLIKVKYCIQDESEGDYLTGAEIIQTGDKLWFDIFSKVHDFIKERMGRIY